MSKYIVPNIGHIWLNVTDACNLRCRYCFVEQHPHYMSWEVAKDSIDLLSKCKDHKHIQFFGGEPTLLWDSIIVPSIEYVHKNNMDIGFGMTTNFILLDEYKLKYLKDNKVSLLFSIDGNKETQDYNRPCPESGKSSFDILEPKMDLILKYNPRITFRSTLIPKTCNNLYDNLMFADSKGFTNSFACPDDFSEWTEDDVRNLENNVNRYSLYLLDRFLNNKPYIRFSPIMKALGELALIDKNRESNKVSRRGTQMCGLGISTYSVNYEGGIFACQQMPSRGYDNNPHYIGDIYNGIDVERRDKLIENYRGHDLTCEDPNLCEECPRRFICNKGFCHSNSFLKFGNEYTKPRIRCLWDIILTKSAYFIRSTLAEALPDKSYSEIIQMLDKRGRDE